MFMTPVKLVDNNNLMTPKRMPVSQLPRYLF